MFNKKSTRGPVRSLLFGPEIHKFTEPWYTTNKSSVLNILKLMAFWDIDFLMKDLLTIQMDLFCNHFVVSAEVE